jgi:predicted dehydrogenase
MTYQFSKVNPQSMHRRDFITVASGAVIGFPLFISPNAFGNQAPSRQITLGFIGLGAQGMGVNLPMFLNEPDAKVVAVCDAFNSRAEKAALIVDEHYGSKGCRVHQDFRRIIEDSSIDAVVISTPDHWHVPISLMALDAGKDVFCEKPTLCIEEGRTLANAVQKHKAIFQAGIEDRSLIHFHKMVEWVKNGAIGQLSRVEVHLPAGICLDAAVKQTE